MPDLIIADGALTARFRPDLGGRLSCLFHKGFGDLVVPMGDEAYDAWCWPKAGAFPLFPYHGGLSGPGFRYSGREVSVTANPMLALPMALHGPAQRRPWTARILGPSELSMELLYAADAEWPFPFAATQHFKLGENGILASFGITNTGNSEMPAGLGWHPYFKASAGRLVRCDARYTWPRDTRLTPGELRRVTRDSEAEIRQASDPYFLSQWSRVEAELDGGARIEITASGSVAHLVVLRTEHYTCIEPVSHVAGALHYLENSREDTGIATLRPGQTMSATIKLRLT